MAEIKLICNPEKGGCGFIGELSKFKKIDDGLSCPRCKKDHAIKYEEKK